MTTPLRYMSIRQEEDGVLVSRGPGYVEDLELIPADPDDDDPDFDPYVLPAVDIDTLEPLVASAEFRDVPRDQQGRWTKGGGGRPIPPPPGPARRIPPPPTAQPAGVLEDVDFSEVQIAYRPRHPDGKADPGEIVWAKVPFEEDPTRSKDRPVLIIGRTSDGENLVAVQLTSKPGRGGERLPVGSGDWDKQGRESYLKLDRFVQVDDVNYRREGSYMKKPAFQKVVDELTERQGTKKIQLAARRFGRSRPLGMCVECGGYFAADVPRANDGRWCKGPGCSGGGVSSQEFPEKFETDWQPIDDAVARPATLNPEKEVDRDRTESAD